MANISRLGAMDEDAFEALTYLDRLLSTRRKIEAEASSPHFSIPVVQTLEAEQAAYFRELHRIMDKIESKTK